MFYFVVLNFTSPPCLATPCRYDSAECSITPSVESDGDGNLNLNVGCFRDARVTVGSATPISLTKLAADVITIKANLDGVTTAEGELGASLQDTLIALEATVTSDGAAQIESLRSQILVEIAEQVAAVREEIRADLDAIGVS